MNLLMGEQQLYSLKAFPALFEIALVFLIAHCIHNNVLLFFLNKLLNVFKSIRISELILIQNGLCVVLVVWINVGHYHFIWVRLFYAFRLY